LKESELGFGIISSSAACFSVKTFVPSSSTSPRIFIGPL
jgi:hypothetical protein